MKRSKTSSATQKGKEEKKKEVHLGIRIKMARIARGITQGELGRRVDKTRPLISHIEQTGKINMQTLRQLCDAMGIGTEDVLRTQANDPAFFFAHNSPAYREIKRLKEEVRLLRQLIDTQKEMIRNMKEEMEHHIAQRRKLTT